MSLIRSSLGDRPRAAVGHVTRRTFRSLGVRNYRLFFTGQLVSVSGTWMQTVAQNWLVLNLTDSGVHLGITVALQFLPMLLFGMWGGLVADRFDKRRVLLAAQAVAGLLALTLWGLVATGTVRLWMVEVMAFLLGMVFVVDMPTRQSFVVEMVGPDEVPNAVGLNSAMFNAGRLIGPALAGVVISTAGVGSAFLVNAGSYLAVIAALVAMRPDELYREPAEDGARAGRRRPGQIRESFSYVWQDKLLRSTLLLVAVVGTFGLNLQVVLPLMARYTFDGGPRLYGALAGVTAFGSLLGALMVAGRARPTWRLLVLAGAGFGMFTMVAAAVPTPLGVAIVLLGAGVLVMLFLASANATLQLNSSPAMRGRVMALYGQVLLGTTPIGAPLLGFVSGQWGARVGLAVCGAASLAACAVALGAPALRRRYPRAATGDYDAAEAEAFRAA
ncbi:MAG: MFS transporter [Acidimicrobiales bacterium]